MCVPSPGSWGLQPHGERAQMDLGLPHGWHPCVADPQIGVLVGLGSCGKRSENITWKMGLFIRTGQLLPWMCFSKSPNDLP